MTQTERKIQGKLRQVRERGRGRWKISENWLRENINRRKIVKYYMKGIIL